MSESREFIALDLALLTISDSRTAADDKSGAVLRDMVTAAGHRIAEQTIVRDDKYAIRATVSGWIADPGVRAVITTGGTGLTGRDVAPEALMPLFDKEIEGFGELFRAAGHLTFFNNVAVRWQCERCDNRQNGKRDHQLD